MRFDVLRSKPGLSRPLNPEKACRLCSDRKDINVSVPINIIIIIIRRRPKCLLQLNKLSNQIESTVSEVTVDIPCATVAVVGDRFHDVQTAALPVTSVETV